ncbi:MAG TPA: hypothetical protein VK177_17945 [Flavobacteriales bacterium]|nr:hypothetical protein [Flavobacteriales bacterium]
MREELHSNLGFYNSAFIKMHVKTTEDLQDFGNISIETEATYFHEFIHFLQDITTTYGLMNISNIVDYIKYSNDFIINDGKPDFTVPIEPTASLDHDVKANWELKKIYLGGGEGKNDIAQVNSICKCATKVVTKAGNVTPEKLVLDYNDSLGRNYKYSIGAYCICESMAYAMEQCLYPDVLIKPNKLPYESIKIICDELLPGLSADPLNIIALCDVSLMSFNPGAFLYDTLLSIAKIGIPNVPEDIYRHAYSNVTFNYQGHTTFQQLLISQGALAINQLGDYFTTIHFKENKSWINYTISSGIDLRLTRPFFMLDIARNGKILDGKKINNTFFNGILYKLGSPLTVNDSFEITLFPPQAYSYDTLPEYFWVINQVYKIYSNKLNQGTYKCEMIEWCNKSCQEIEVEEWTDERCRNAPWERSKDPDPNPCTFGRLWKTWGLMDEYPV